MAAGDSSTPKAREALETLCNVYWYPIYAFLRRAGCGPEEAEDLVQGFFLHLLQREVLRSVQREGGRFRSFLLATLKHYWGDQKDKADAQKRGGKCCFISWEKDLAERQFLHEPVDIDSSDRLFERRWALVLLERAMARLRNEAAAAGKAGQFDQLQGFVSGEMETLSYAEAAKKTHLSESALKSAIWRLRRRYHEIIREEVGQTVADPKEVDDELRYLLGLFSGK